MRMFGLIVPCFQWPLGIPVTCLFVKRDQFLSADYMHNLIGSQRIVNLKVPLIGTLWYL